MGKPACTGLGGLLLTGTDSRWGGLVTGLADRVRPLAAPESWGWAWVEVGVDSGVGGVPGVERGEPSGVGVSAD